MSVKAEGPGAPLGLIDTAFDFRSDTPERPRADPDSDSPTLRRYHKILWSKPLPRGALFTLDDTQRGAYLYHCSDLGEFWLGSDAVMQTFIRWPEMRHITEQLSPAENDEFYALGYTIGGMMVFPGNQIDRRMTINQALGMTNGPSPIAWTSPWSASAGSTQVTPARSETPLHATQTSSRSLMTSAVTPSSSSCKTWSRTTETESGSSPSSRTSVPLLDRMTSRNTGCSAPTPSSSSQQGIVESLRLAFDAGAPGCSD